MRMRVLADPERFDLVVIGTPPGTHVDLATRAIEAGIAVVVDKPFCATRAEAQGLADLAATSAAYPSSCSRTVAGTATSARSAR